MSDRIHAVLIDDEPAANLSMQALLRAGHPDVDVAGIATSVGAALLLIEEKRPELLFLDINLPDGTGFGLVRQLPIGERPEIIFVTSEPSLAQQAFKVAALGYLVKPVLAAELSDAIEIARLRIRQRNSEARLRALLDNMADKDHRNKKVGIPSESGVEFVRAGDIIYCEGVDGYTKIVLTGGETRLSSYNIGEYRKMLEPMDFLAVHRSYLASKFHVRGWLASGELRLSEERKVPVSRRRKPKVMAWLT